MLFKHIFDGIGIRNISFNKNIFFVFRYVFEIFRIPGIGKLVEIDQFKIRMFLEELPDKVATDKSAAPGYEDGFHFLLGEGSRCFSPGISVEISSKYSLLPPLEPTMGDSVIFSTLAPNSVNLDLTLLITLSMCSSGNFPLRNNWGSAS